MTPQEAQSAAYEEFLSGWASRTQVRLDGREQGMPEPAPGVEWVRVSFRNYGGGQQTLGPPAGSPEAPVVGGRKYRRLGAVFVQVFVPTTAGSGRGATLAHEARAILEGRTLEADLHLYDGIITEIPLPRGEPRHQTNVEVRCAYDETK